jgi:hypothetical protein
MILGRAFATLDTPFDSCEISLIVGLPVVVEHEEPSVAYPRLGFRVIRLGKNQ